METRKILNKIEKIKYEKSRKKYLSKVISRIGIIEEYEDNITCYVEQELLEKNSRKGFYELFCNGMNTTSDESKKLVDYFKLNKPVYYIFDGINFDTIVNICSSFSNIIFRNCTFKIGIRIFFADSITLENNKYNCWTDIKEYGNAFLWGKAKNLEINNETFVNKSDFKNYNENNFGINVDVEKLNINNSTISAESNGQINIKANETILSRSKISGPEIYLDSDTIVYSRSLLKSENGIIIENKNCDCDTEAGFYNVDSPYTIYNGREIITNCSSPKDDKLKESRQNIYNLFTNIINKCNQKTLVKTISQK